MVRPRQPQFDYPAVARLIVVRKFPQLRRKYPTSTETPRAIFCVTPALRSQLYSRLFHPLVYAGSVVSGEICFPKNGLPGLEWQTYLYNLAAHALVAFAGYAIFGGLKLFVAERSPTPVSSGESIFTSTPGSGLPTLPLRSLFPGLATVSTGDDSVNP